MRVGVLLLFFGASCLGADLLPLVDSDTCNVYMLIAKDKGAEGAAVGLDSVEDQGYGAPYRIEVAHNKSKSVNSIGDFEGLSEAVEGIRVSDGNRLRFVTLDSQRNRFVLQVLGHRHVIPDEQVEVLNQIFQNRGFKVSRTKKDGPTSSVYFFKEDGKVGKEADSKFKIQVSRSKSSIDVAVFVRNPTTTLSGEWHLDGPFLVGLVQEGKMHAVEYVPVTRGLIEPPETLKASKPVEIVILGY